MSNIGKKPIKLAEGISVRQEQGKVVVTGPKGTLTTRIPGGISVTVEDGNVLVRMEDDKREMRKYFGLTRSLLANMVIGVSSGFEKKLELSGVGYRARTEDDSLVLSVGFAVPVRIKTPNGIGFRVDENIITVSGIDKQLVGNTASIVRGVRIPDPYKAKGIKYVGEHIRRKVGKAVKAVGTK